MTLKPHFKMAGNYEAIIKLVIVVFIDVIFCLIFTGRRKTSEVKNALEW